MGTEVSECLATWIFNDKCVVGQRAVRRDNVYPSCPVQDAR